MLFFQWCSAFSGSWKGWLMLDIGSFPLGLIGYLQLKFSLKSVEIIQN